MAAINVVTFIETVSENDFENNITREEVNIYATILGGKIIGPFEN